MLLRILKHHCFSSLRETLYNDVPFTMSIPEYRLQGIDESPPVEVRRAYVDCIKSSITSLKKRFQGKHALVA